MLFSKGDCIMAKQTGESAGSCGNNTAKKKLFSEIPYLKGKRLTLKRLTRADRSALQELVDSPRIYRYLPTFLFEQKYPDIGYVIDHLYDECWKESIILGVFLGDEFCGLAEMYGYRDPIHKISVGYRLLERYWGKGIAKEALGMMIEYLYDETDIEIITASTMVENQASANVLKKNGFQMVVHAVDEDWGYDKPTVSDKWIR
jgi:ribosomal-protein-alanine N-acetyltransferase